jgi:hypothetical protein
MSRLGPAPVHDGERLLALSLGMAEDNSFLTDPLKSLVFSTFTLITRLPKKTLKLSMQFETFYDTFPTHTLLDTIMNCFVVGKPEASRVEFEERQKCDRCWGVEGLFVDE